MGGRWAREKNFIAVILGHSSPEAAIMAGIRSAGAIYIADLNTDERIPSG